MLSSGLNTTNVPSFSVLFSIGNSFFFSPREKTTFFCLPSRTDITSKYEDKALTALVPTPVETY